MLCSFIFYFLQRAFGKQYRQHFVRFAKLYKAVFNFRQSAFANLLGLSRSKTAIVLFSGFFLP